MTFHCVAVQKLTLTISPQMVLPFNNKDNHQCQQNEMSPTSLMVYTVRLKLNFICSCTFINHLYVHLSFKQASAQKGGHCLHLAQPEQ